MLLRMQLALVGAEDWSNDLTWDFTKSTHSLLFSMLGTTSSEIIFDPKSIDDTYEDCAGAVLYILNRVRNIDNCVINSVRCSYPNIITVGVRGIGAPVLLTSTNGE